MSTVVGAKISARIAEVPAASGGSGEDRVRVGSNAVVVLDGASGTDCGVSVSKYVDSLADYLIDTLNNDSDAPLTEVVSEAIGLTGAALELVPRRAPSSTVSIVRRSTTTVDLLVLGDSPVYVAHCGTIDRLSDDRLARLHLPSRSQLFKRLAAGHGYDTRHKEIARQMAREKAPYMNRSDGYWIAEADVQAGANALVHSYPAHEVMWCVTLTDGVDGPASHLGIAVRDLASQDEDSLRDMLHRIHNWENETDPDGKQLPRFKRHDDKTIAVVQFT